MDRIEFVRLKGIIRQTFKMEFISDEQRKAVFASLSDRGDKKGKGDNLFSGDISSLEQYQIDAINKGIKRVKDIYGGYAAKDIKIEIVDDISQPTGHGGNPIKINKFWFNKNALLNYKKGEIPYQTENDLSDIIVHELGHNIEYDLNAGEFKNVTDYLPPSKQREMGLDPMKSLSMRMENGLAFREGQKLSEYSRANGSEYFAEAFVAFVNGNTSNINPELLGIFRKVTNR